MAGYKVGQWVSFPTNINWAITGTSCRYDADGQLYRPCDNTAPQLSFDGPNVIGTNTKWRFIHAPGVDEPLIARYEHYTGQWLRELYFVTDGRGRQLSVGDEGGSLHEDDLNGAKADWRFNGAARNATGFGAERLGPGDMPGVSLFRNRASRTGRWTQEDPIGVAGGINLYQFNGNDPVAYTDPFGLCPICRAALRLVSRAGPTLRKVGSAIGKTLSRGTRGPATLERATDTAVRGARGLQGAGRQIFEAARAVGEQRLSQADATSAVTRAISRLGYEAGPTVAIDGVNYVTAAAARGGVVDAVAIHANGTTTRAALRLAEKGFEVVKDLGKIAAP